MSKRFLMLLAAMLLFVGIGVAGVITYTPTTPGDVGSSINSDGFFVFEDTTGLAGRFADVYGFHLDAYGSSYADAGLVLGLGNNLTLGQIQSVSAVSTGEPLAMNIWLDSGGDGQIFKYGIGGMLTSLNGDSYATCDLQPLNSASNCYIMAGNGAGGTYTLSALQSGGVSGIGVNTLAQVWVGISGSENAPHSADISSITLTTAEAVPEPATWTMLCMGLALCFFGLQRKTAPISIGKR